MSKFNNNIIIDLKTEVSSLRWKALEQRIKRFIKKSWKIFCKWLNKRPIYIDEYLYFIGSRNGSDKNHRKRSFFSCIELIKQVKKENLTNKKVSWKKISYEFKWITPKWYLVWVHIVELSDKKNKKLKLMSTFWNKKKA